MSESQALTICLPFPPSVNGYWRYGRLANGRRMHMISKRGRAFRTAALQVLREEAFEALRMAGRLSVKIELFPPDRRRRDVDNYPKAVLDALTHSGIWHDDEQVDDLRIVRREVRKGGECIVHIVERENADDE